MSILLIIPLVGKDADSFSEFDIPLACDLRADVEDAEVGLDIVVNNGVDNLILDIASIALAAEEGDGEDFVVGVFMHKSLS